eukprot:gnl/Chilomastix_cuspidata/1423.p1 GENE.gnl/Chilomastix_cuspidata/1423~~gnl/Chilomastix_cuspidata/1423.p1  ORF type:complete len:1532 (+),score=260.76 gnl/Chilomastix_cuspidata/1423:417-5012(+)
MSHNEEEKSLMDTLLEKLPEALQPLGLEVLESGDNFASMYFSFQKKAKDVKKEILKMYEESKREACSDFLKIFKRLGPMDLEEYFESLFHNFQAANTLMLIIIQNKLVVDKKQLSETKKTHKALLRRLEAAMEELGQKLPWEYYHFASIDPKSREKTPKVNLELEGIKDANNMPMWTDHCCFCNVVLNSGKEPDQRVRCIDCGITFCTNCFTMICEAIRLSIEDVVSDFAEIQRRVSMFRHLSCFGHVLHHWCVDITDHPVFCRLPVTRPKLLFSLVDAIFSNKEYAKLPVFGFEPQFGFPVAGVDGYRPSLVPLPFLSQVTPPPFPDSMRHLLVTRTDARTGIPRPYLRIPALDTIQAHVESSMRVCAEARVIATCVFLTFEQSAVLIRHLARALAATVGNSIVGIVGTTPNSLMSYLLEIACCQAAVSFILFRAESGLKEFEHCAKHLDVQLLIAPEAFFASLDAKIEEITDPDRRELLLRPCARWIMREGADDLFVSTVPTTPQDGTPIELASIFSVDFPEIPDERNTEAVCYSTTGGSSGKVKFAETTHKAFIRTANAFKSFIMMNRSLSYEPSAHGTDRGIVWTCLFNGNCVMFPARWRGIPYDLPELFTFIHSHVRPGVQVMPPTVLRFLQLLFNEQIAQGASALQTSARFQSIMGDKNWSVVTGGAKVDPQLLEFITNDLELNANESYGSTELGGIAFEGHFLDLLNWRILPVAEYSSPTPFESAEGQGDTLTLFNGAPATKLPGPIIGELLGRSEEAFSSYLGDPELVADRITEERFIYTKDVVRLEPDLSMSVVGRLGLAVKLANSRFISPYEVENAFISVPKIRETIRDLLIHAELGAERPVMIASVGFPGTPTQEEITKKEFEILGLIRKHFGDVGLESWQLPSTVIVDPEEWTVANGKLTDTFKPCPQKVLTAMKHRIDSLGKVKPPVALAATTDSERKESFLHLIMRAASEVTAPTSTEDEFWGFDPDTPLAYQGFDSMSTSALLVKLRSRFPPALLPFVSNDIVFLPLREFAAKIQKRPSADTGELPAADSKKEIIKPKPVGPQAPPTLMGVNMPEDDIAEGIRLLEKLTETERPAEDTAPHKTDVNVSFITGTTGFLGGQFLAHSLCEHLGNVVLVRARDTTHAYQRVAESLREVGWNPQFSVAPPSPGHDLLEILPAEERESHKLARETYLLPWNLVCVSGNLSEKNFGLPPELARSIYAHIRRYFLIGASTDFSLPYNEIRNHNVVPLFTALRFSRRFLSTNARQSAEIHYVSSTGIFSGSRYEISYSEITPVPDIAKAPHTQSPYTLSKIVCEKILQSVSDRAALRVIVHRPGMIGPAKGLRLATHTFRSRAGVNTREDWVTRMIRAVAELRVAPTFDVLEGINLIPVDAVVKGMLQLRLVPPPSTPVVTNPLFQRKKELEALRPNYIPFHFQNKKKVLPGRIFAYLENFLGAPIKTTSFRFFCQLAAAEVTPFGFLGMKVFKKTLEESSVYNLYSLTVCNVTNEDLALDRSYFFAFLRWLAAQRLIAHGARE